MININSISDQSGARPDENPFAPKPSSDWKVVEMGGPPLESEFSGADELLDVFSRSGLQMGRCFPHVRAYDDRELFEIAAPMDKRGTVLSLLWIPSW